MIEITVVNKIGDKLKEHKQKYGITKTFVAERAGITKQTLNTIANSENPTIVTMARIAYALDCNMDELFEVKIKQR